MRPIITAFESSPDRGRGLARDVRVRWAFEEVGQPYDVRLLSFAAMKQPAHLALHPFGQIPTYEADGLVLFESGAVVLHIAQRHPGLLPHDEHARARGAKIYAEVVGFGMSADAGDLLRERRRIGADGVLVFADVKKKHSSHALTADVDIAETARAAEFCLADGVVVTGAATGCEADDIGRAHV